MRDRKTDQHRTVATAKLGRPIKPGYDIDHLNENKLDNSPANLVEKSHSQHSQDTQSPGRKSLRRLQKALTMPQRREKLY